MRTVAVLVATVAMLFSQLLIHGASAASVPILSGPYNLMTTNMCQASVPVTNTTVFVPGPNGQVATDVMTIDPNQITFTGTLNPVLLSITFNDGSFTAAGTSWMGDLVFTGTLSGSQPGLTSNPMSSSGTYTNTATQLTLNISGQGTNVYQVLYSDFVGDSARHLDLVNVYTSYNGFGCVEKGTAVYAGRSSIIGPIPGPITPGLSK
jgi:hypothetical protein